MLTLYGLKNCDACKKALAALRAAGREVAFIDIRDEADLPAKLPVWIAALGLEALLNKRSTTWRGLEEAEKASAEASEQRAAALMIAHPTLIKRPVIENGQAVTSGWSKKVEAALL